MNRVYLSVVNVVICAEYDMLSMSPLAATQGKLDFDYDNADLESGLSIDGAWVNARVWVPKQWIQTD